MVLKNNSSLVGLCLSLHGHDQPQRRIEGFLYGKRYSLQIPARIENRKGWLFTMITCAWVVGSQMIDFSLVCCKEDI